MIIDIFPGQKFSRIKLFLKTNKFFHTLKFSKIITDKDKNYVISIGKHSIKIITATSIQEEDLIMIRRYIESMFTGHSILVESTTDLRWMLNLEDVSVTIAIESYLQRSKNYEEHNQQEPP